MRLLSIFLIVLFLVSCANIQDYQAPTAEVNVANLRVIATTENLNAYHVLSDDCENFAKIATFNNLFFSYTEEESSIGMPWTSSNKKKPDPDSYQEVVIPAEKDFHLFYQAFVGKRIIWANGVFYPETGKNYEVSLGYGGIISGQLVEKSDQVTLIPLKISRPKESCRL